MKNSSEELQIALEIRLRPLGGVRRAQGAEDGFDALDLGFHRGHEITPEKPAAGPSIRK
jgi:hypothetical protein